MKKPLLILLCAWIIPGGGHFLLGERTKGFLFFCLLVPTYIFGAYMTDFSLYFLVKNRLFLIINIFIGFPITIFLYMGAQPHNLTFVPPYMDIGFLYTNVASLLNILLCFKVYFIIQRNTKT